ncbi:hypothetical protein SLEP1_g32409 [Rubroshorea leprosula]|uniref:Reverse transcriptase domain-containing protein n=1 Tax=Rubroshorea leprosula TaxID=152421 RepID=A0AAV5KD68_9ROSI|nr:hypothetical protein SLEP1_g32409 [Rubroshorea leprosula]
MVNIVVKSLKAEDHLTDLAKTFDNLRKHNMRLNPAKCVFGIKLGKFLGFMVSRRGIEVNPEKIKAIEEMKPSKSVKDVQRLTRRVAALYRFISKSADKCLPFFKVLRFITQKDEVGKLKFKWTLQCQAAFDELKRYLSLPPLLTKVEEGEILYLYLEMNSNVETELWTLNVDGSSNNKRTGSVHVEVLSELSFQKLRTMEINSNLGTPNWIDIIRAYLQDGTVPDDKQEEMKLRARHLSIL